MLALSTRRAADSMRKSRWLRSRINRWRQIRAMRIERALGIDTITMPAGAANAKHFCADATWYDVMDYAVLRRYLGHLKLGPNDTLVDVGCGMGRIVCQCAQGPLRRCIGVEIDPLLAQRARENALRLRARQAPIEIVVSDAACFDFSGATAIVLFNPFGEATCRAMLRSVHESLMRCPGPLRIGYFNPVCAAVFDEQPWLKRTGEDHSPLHHYRAIYWTASP